jgi:protease II
MFQTNEVLKLFDKTNDDLERAIITEKAYLEVVTSQVEQLRELLFEESHHKNQFKGLSTLQERQINSLGIKHIRHTSEIERNLTMMNEQINDCIDKGQVTLK